MLLTADGSVLRQWVEDINHHFPSIHLIVVKTGYAWKCDSKHVPKRFQKQGLDDSILIASMPLCGDIRRFRCVERRVDH